MNIADFATQVLAGGGGTYGNPLPVLVRNQGTYQGQCVSGERQALAAIDGVNWGAVGDAVDYANSANQARYASIGYTWKPGDTNFQDGDVLVWGDDPGTFTGPEGHIARWFAGKLLNQNYNGSKKYSQNNFFSAGYLGRYTKEKAMFNEQNRIDVNVKLYKTDKGFFKDAVGKVKMEDSLYWVLSSPEFTGEQFVNAGDVVNLNATTGRTDAATVVGRLWKDSAAYGYLMKNWPQTGFVPYTGAPLFVPKSK